MRTKPFTPIMAKSEELMHSLLQKHASLLKGLSVSFLSEKNFRKTLQGREGIKEIYFTKDEINYCKNRVSSLAGRYAAKKAINKAFKKRVPHKNINILSSQTGEPFPSFSGSTNPLISISISHEEDLVTAFAAYASRNNTVAVGIDATSITRISALVPQTKITQKILTPGELREIKNPPVNLAEKWAGKEAVSKAIGIGIWHGASLRDIEILTLKGKPFIKLHGKVLQQAKSKGLSRWSLDYIHDEKFVLAFVIASA